MKMCFTKGRTTADACNGWGDLTNIAQINGGINLTFAEVDVKFYSTLYFREYMSYSLSVKLTYQG